MKQTFKNLTFIGTIAIALGSCSGTSSDDYPRTPWGNDKQVYERV